MPATLQLPRLAYPVSEAATLLDVNPETVRRAVRSGALKAIGGPGRLGYRVSAVELERWWKAQGGGELFPESVAT